MGYQERGRVKIGAGGRVVIPAHIREALGVTEGSELSFELEGGELRFLTAKERIRRAQELFRLHDKGTGSIVDELIADRRAEADRE